jgi:hypothetical protein
MCGLSGASGTLGAAAPRHPARSRQAYPRPRPLTALGRLHTPCCTCTQPLTTPVTPRNSQNYFHYLYKMREQPPFEPCALSAELPLVFRKPRAPNDPRAAIQRQRIWKDTSRTAFVAGLHLERAPPAALAGGRSGAGPPRLLISYGSSDIDSRLLVLGLRELEDLFRGRPSTC